MYSLVSRNAHIRMSHITVQKRISEKTQVGWGLFTLSSASITPGGIHAEKKLSQFDALEEGFL
jgi:hypothetical protein